jgi:D-aminopeptidase
MRLRELGISIGTGRPGRWNAISDVRGVRVGHTTLIDGDSVRTGVTVVLPREESPADEPLFAGAHRLNGNGELTGLEWVRESGMLTSPIALTNTYSVGVVRDALISSGLSTGLPVVGETYDGMLNDIQGMHVSGEHVDQALRAAAEGPIEEGNVGGGTGMICHGFKGGIGTASRVLDRDIPGYTVGVLVQANHGRRERLRVDGRPVGELLANDRVPLPSCSTGPAVDGSIIVLVATDAPLLPRQCDRLAQRAGFGIARTGGVGEHASGDMILAFSTPNRGLFVGESGPVTAVTTKVEMLSNAFIDPLFDAVIEATEEAILNAVLAAETMTGRAGATAYALAPELLREAWASLGPAA